MSPSGDPSPVSPGLPPGRSGHSAVWDAETKWMFVFGGSAPGSADDLWAYDSAANSWAQLTPPTPPQLRRAGHSAVWDSLHNLMLVFAGATNFGDPATYRNDVWAYDPEANAWNQLVPSGALPPARYNHASVWEPPPGNRMLVFGGAAQPFLNDLWALSFPNTLPVIDAASPSVTVAEGQTASNTGTYSDPEAGQTVTITASLGTVTKTGTNSGTWSWSLGTSDGPDQSQTVAVGADDGNNGIVTTTFMLTVNNVPPTVTLSGATSADEGQTKTYTLAVTDPGQDTFSVSAGFPTCGTGGSVVPGSLSLNASGGSFQCAFPEGPATTTVSVQVADSDGAASNTATVQVTVSNVAPALSNVQVSPPSIPENGTATLNGNISDPSVSDTFTLAIRWGDGSPTHTLSLGAATTAFSVTHQYLDDSPTGTPADSNPIAVTVADDDGGSADAATTVTVTNVPPVITGVTGPGGPLAVGTAVTVTATYADVGPLDTHTCTFAWDDGSPDTVVPGSGGSCNAARAYASAGVYTVGILVTDDDTGTAASAYQFVVVYDPSAGYVTGGGWIDSLAGAYTPSPTPGKATFGFVSRYQRGANVPTGQTEFQFRAASFNFHSTDYQWLVVSGAKAQYKGTGTVNGAAGYSFLLTVTDGQRPGGGGVDKFRIKIWNSGGVVYDNVSGSSDDMDDANPQAIGGGSIVIHE